MKVVSRFLDRRRALAVEFFRIEAVERDARALVEELRRRRDGVAARRLDLSHLREALDEVDARVGAGENTPS